MNLVKTKSFIRIKKVSREQQKIIYIALIVLVSLACFWFFIYAPQSRKFAALRKKLNQAEARIRQITSIAEGKSLATAVGELKAALLKVSSQFPAEDEGVIAALSEGCRRLKIEVKNIVPSPAKSLGERVAGYDIQELPISLKLSGEFRSVGRYLDVLRNNFPILIRVRDIQIQGKGEGRPDLDVTLQLSAYLASEKQ